MNRTASARAALCGLWLTTAPALAAGTGDLPGARMAESVCLPCHGPRGISATPIYPSLAGLPAAYITKQLDDFRGGRRVNALMSPIAAGLSPAQVEALGAYYAALLPPPGAMTSDARAAAGERLYLGGNAARRIPACSACHGPGAAGIPPQFPRLAGQQSAYLQAQLQNFGKGSRGNDLNSMMRDIAARLSPGDMAALSAYLSGLSTSRQ